MEINEDIIIPTPEQIQEIENDLIEHEAFSITMEWQEKLRLQSKNDLGN